MGWFSRWASCSHLRASVTKQYNLVLVEGRWRSSAGKVSDVNKDWTHKDQDKDKDQSHKDKDKDLTYKDSKQKRRQAQHSFFKTVSLNVFKKHWNTK